MKKENTIKNNKEIQDILNTKNATVGSNFIIYKKENHDDRTRFAISVSKKFGNAVKRNQIKRRVRAVVDQNNYKKYDIFIIIRPKAKNLNFDEICKELNVLFLEAKILED